MGRMGQIGFINSFVGNERQRKSAQTEADFKALEYNLKVQKATSDALEKKQNLEMKRAEFRLKQDEFDLEKKKVKSDLEYKKMTGEMSAAAYNDFMKRIKDAEKYLTAEKDYVGGQLDVATDTINKQLDVLGQLQPEIRMSFGQNGPSTTVTYKERKTDPEDKVGVRKMKLEADKALGAIENGGFYDEGTFVEFEDRKDAERFANANLGSSYEKKYPEAQKMLDKTYGPQPKSLPIEKFKKESNPLRAAYEYLVNEVGMEPEAAKQYLEKVN